MSRRGSRSAKADKLRNQVSKFTSAKEVAKMKTRTAKIGRGASWPSLMLVACALFPPSHVKALGHWTPLARQPSGAVGLMLLLPDGTVMAASRVTDPTETPPSSGSRIWYRLTPDIRGSYTNGTWTTNSPMNSTRLWYSSAVLRDGRVFVAGAEYGTGGATVELYDPGSDAWTQIPVPAGLVDTSNPGDGANGGFRDSGCKLLSDGTVLMAPVFPVAFNGTVIFDPNANSLAAGPPYRRNQEEASWVKLPDDSILTIDSSDIRAERYIPSLRRWIDDSDVQDHLGNPVDLYDLIGGEIGAAMLLPDSRAIFLGATGKSALYTPTGDTNTGTWAAGPIIPRGLITADAPLAMMANGKILCAVGPALYQDNGGKVQYPPPTSFFEYDYSIGTTGTFTQVSSPTGTADNTDSIAQYKTLMLNLPDGTVLYSHFGSDLYVYQPDGSPLLAGKPSISSITLNGNGSYHLSGTGINGISEGAAYGDDAQMDSNYPLVRLTGGSGNVFYARTYNWSSTSVMTGNRPVTTEFTLPAGLPVGSYSLVVVANGIASDPVTFYSPAWVQYGLVDPGNGTYMRPYNTLAQGTNAVTAGGTILFKFPGSTPERPRLSKPMTIRAVGGPATIGR